MRMMDLLVVLKLENFDLNDTMAVKALPYFRVFIDYRHKHGYTDRLALSRRLSFFQCHVQTL